VCLEIIFSSKIRVRDLPTCKTHASVCKYLMRNGKRNAPCLRGRWSVKFFDKKGSS
jgi:hypothetical protein